MLDEGADMLDKYLSLAATVSGAEAAALCLKATGDPSLHVFGELLDAPSIAALASTPLQPSLDLLRLFAYDTYAEYSSGKGRFPALSDAHIRKLRRLSVVSLANQSNIISYDHLRTCLEVKSVREVEDAVLDAVYTGLIRARLDQRAELVEVFSAVGRDVVPHSGIADMHTLLSNWAATAQKVVHQIDRNIAHMKQETANSARERAYVQQMAANMRADLSSSSLPNPGRSRDGERHRRHGASTSHGAGSSADGWRLPGSRSIRSRFEM